MGEWQSVIISSCFFPSPVNYRASSSSPLSFCYFLSSLRKRKTNNHSFIHAISKWGLKKFLYLLLRSTAFDAISLSIQLFSRIWVISWSQSISQNSVAVNFIFSSCQMQPVSSLVQTQLGAKSVTYSRLLGAVVNPYSSEVVEFSENHAVRFTVKMCRPLC